MPVLGGLHPKHIVAVGESQSAFYLTTFADALQPLSHTFDGIFIHSRGGAGPRSAGSSITSSTGPDNLRIRTDLHVPVFMFETQTDLIELGYAAGPAAQHDRIRTWEVAGTSHADAYVVGSAPSRARLHDPDQQRPAAHRGPGRLHRLRQVGGQRHATAYPHRSRCQHASGRPGARRHGNVIGGVRTPAVDVPVSTLSGAAAPGTSAICSLFGSTTAFTPAQLASLYGTKSHYLAE